jgi:hypothetical protein
LGAREAHTAVVAAAWSVRCRQNFFVDFVLQFVMNKQKWAELEKKT